MTIDNKYSATWTPSQSETDAQTQPHHHHHINELNVALKNKKTKKQTPIKPIMNKLKTEMIKSTSTDKTLDGADQIADGNTAAKR